MARFINQSLEYEWGFLLNDIAMIKRNGHRAYVNTFEIDFPVSPFVIDIEEVSFFYERQADRDKDVANIKRILTKNKITVTTKKVW